MAGRVPFVQHGKTLQPGLAAGLVNVASSRRRPGSNGIVESLEYRAVGLQLRISGGDLVEIIQVRTAVVAIAELIGRARIEPAEATCGADLRKSSRVAMDPKDLRTRRLNFAPVDRSRQHFHAKFHHHRSALLPQIGW